MESRRCSMAGLTVLVPILALLALNVAGSVLVTVPARHRSYLLPAILLPAAVSLTMSEHLEVITGLSEIWALITLIALTHYVSLLYIRKWKVDITPSDVQQQKLSSDKASQKPIFIRSTAIHAATPLKSRLIFLLLRFFTVTVILNDVAIHPPFLSPSLNPDDFSPSSGRTLLARLLLRSRDAATKREIYIRSWLTISMFMHLSLVLDALHTICAIVFIYVSRMDTLQDWPDMFGSPLQAFTLARFWGKYWQRVQVVAYRDFVDVLLPSRMLSNPAARKVANVVFAFLFSALLHQTVAAVLYPQCAGIKDLADVKFFALNAVGVLLECGLLAGFEEIGRHFLPGSSRRRGAARLQVQQGWQVGSDVYGAFQRASWDMPGCLHSCSVYFRRCTFRDCTAT
ncbi:uncharacterized protein AB675_9638 [Cyphellophora attinorum]|uniref:Wax synthase domain-containing protein n=1 Tax=Cyphellophora attinorum TaxID=1664694 RepID=A0A0N1HTD9_9EURO|nr:uncharacterized protein AB675_9638 [Phialophora attinorum]KPI42256.1 hypothetical protein AB675_9638 [Phialophora attinorum]